MSAVEPLNLVDGSWEAASASLDELDPTTGDRLCTVPRSSPGDVARAADAATRAAEGWAALPPPERGDVLFRASAVVEERARALAETMCAEVGKPIGEATGEVVRTAAILRYFAGEARRAGGLLPPPDGQGMTLVLREPLGVVGLITPWNFPLAIPAWKLAPALVMGNAVVLKPAEEAARSCATLAACLTDAGLPPGVLNVVCGDADTGRALVEAAPISAISFTGSAAAGAEVRLAAAGRGIRAQLEMGGKNAAIVLADADLHRAAAVVASGAFAFAGQKCTATGLALVDRSVAGAFRDALERAARAVTVGVPSDASTVCGPVIREDAAARAISFGAARARREGFFVRPLVLWDAPRGEVTDGELFVPVLPALEVDGIDEALDIANALPTGLSAAVHTQRADHVLRFMRRMQAGVLAVNRPTTGLEVQAPFGGLKASGSEHKEQGPGAVEFYTRSKTVYWA